MHDFEAHTYDFTVSNNTKDEVSDFLFKLTFDRDVFLFSAWNGALEIHQHTDSGELVDLVPDLRVFKPENHTLKTFTVDGESMIWMHAGDYLVYHPSSSMNAMEMPIEPFEGTTPGIILYVSIGENLDGSVVELEYTYHRQLTDEPMFLISLLGMLIWLIALVIFAITSAQIKKYQERHERDNEIIEESIETFTGFIDAKDPYTNGHSKRVAAYTRLIAKEFGYEGEELDRIYYIALLHDCGKIGVPDNILGKPGKLTDEEFEIIKSHTVRGGDVLKNISLMPEISIGARSHHERPDGRGYPQGLSGDEIPRVAQIIAVADCFDAMYSDRPYRKRINFDKAVSIIKEVSGTQLTPDVVDAFLRLVEKGEFRSPTDHGGGSLETIENIRNEVVA